MFELPKAYVAKDVEKKWYTFWESNGFFTPDPKSTKPPYTIVMPPPNVTGVLHMGHALVNTIQDILIRYKRMSGFNTLWVPGTDHAGIATQTVVERNLMKATGKRRTEFSRKEFLDHVWEWKEKSETEIISQLKRQGVSCDWSRKRFTMDEGNNIAVRAMFKRLFDEGLIYRGDYLVHWDPVTQTALADDEVEYEERNSFLWHFSYPLKDGSGSIEIATTRPETMLGDTAIAVAPKDARYSHLIGKMVLLPLTGREIPIIADDHVDPHFGTGVVKVTPAHDHNDYQIGLRHNLPMINIMTSDGKVNSNGGRFASMTFEEARKAVVAAMKEEGRLVKIVPHINRIGLSYRSKAVIEPHLSKQWFMRMSAFKDALKEVITSKKAKIVPERWDATYFHWIDNLRDWCISRQLWWGHQIPIWYHKKNRDTILCYDGEGLPPEVREAPDDWEQDHDVLDTWFSAALWPFSTLGWPEKSEDLKKFYPTSVLVTGHDILFFWVARMLMMGEYALQAPPFPDVFLHGLIYGKSYWRNQAGGGIAYVSNEERKEYDLGKPVPKDVTSHWEKMSKSKGNVIDPNEIIDEYGADAMRMALASCAISNPQIDLDRRRFEEYKNFANKMWNGARFVFMNIEELQAKDLAQGIDQTLFSLEDKWILTRLYETCKKVTQHLDAYSFDLATQEAYEFYWNEFCAYYVEIIKPVLFGKKGTPEEKLNKQKILVVVLLQAIRLLHPMAPFITEELFQLMKTRFQTDLESSELYTKEALDALKSKACIEASYPKPLGEAFTTAEEEFNTISRCIYTCRNIRGEMKLAPNMATDIYLYGPKGEKKELLQKNSHILQALLKINTLSFEEPLKMAGSVATMDEVQIFIPLPAELMEQEKLRLAKEEKRLLEQIAQQEARLSNQAFLEKAPLQLVEKQQGALQQMKKELEAVQKSL